MGLVRGRFSGSVAQRLNDGWIDIVEAETAFDSDGSVCAGGRCFRDCDSSMIARAAPVYHWGKSRLEG
jgi:hypothetical protein